MCTGGGTDIFQRLLTPFSWMVLLYTPACEMGSSQSMQSGEEGLCAFLRPSTTTSLEERRPFSDGIICTLEAVNFLLSRWSTRFASREEFRKRGPRLWDRIMSNENTNNTPYGRTRVRLSSVFQLSIRCAAERSLPSRSPLVAEDRSLRQRGVWRGFVAFS